MQKTANYQLNQWESSDRIRMEDFNRDNAKIDAALAEAASQSIFTLLKTATVGTGGSACQIDVSDVDWSQWQYVMLDVDLKGSGYAYIKPNNLNSGNWNSLGSSTSGMTGLVKCDAYQRLIFSVATLPGRKIAVISEEKTCGGSNSVSYSSLDTLNLVAADGASSIGSGATLTLWGVR